MYVTKIWTCPRAHNQYHTIEEVSNFDKKKIEKENTSTHYWNNTHPLFPAPNTTLPSQELSQF